MSTEVSSKAGAPGMEVTIHTPAGDVKLNPAIVRRYLVNGDGAVSDQEIAMFLGLCRYQQLNPFLREAYLIKYGNYPAAIVTAKEVFLKRARKSEQFRGYRAGVIYIEPESKALSFTEGMVPPGGKLAGGWAEVHMQGWEFPLKVEVSFDEYVAKKKDGTPNRMWSEKPATMIRKVALVQALREAFPDTYQGMYSEEEIASEELPKDEIDPQQIIDVGAASEQAETHSVGQQDRRRRANKFTGLDKSIYGATELNTCGATPEQLIELRGYMRSDPRVKEMVDRNLQTIGYSELSYFRQDEAQELIDLLRPTDVSDSSQAVPEAQNAPDLEVPDDLIECPLNPGERRSKSVYCLKSCPDRKSTGFCPALGEDPPVSNGGML